LLFYTDGINVWNNNNQIIQNGFDLYGYSSLWPQQRVVIVPKPGNTERYYIFTLSSIDLGNPAIQGRGGIHYSVVDFINGVWQVSFKNIALKNTIGDLIDFPLDPYQNNPVFITTESRMTTALHRDGDKIWLSVIADFYYNQQHTKKFFNYLISSTGINGYVDGVSNPTPSVETLVTTPYYSNLDLSVTSMKVSPNGLFLCDGEEVVDLFNYDNLNGTISFEERIFDGTTAAPVGYGIEFSPNSALVYFTFTPQGIIQSDFRGNKKSLVVNQKPGLYQYSLENDSLRLIYRFPTRENILTPIPTPDYCYGLQLGIDDNIYVCINSSPYSRLGFIDDPNVPGVNCNFNTTCNPNIPSNLMLPQWVHKTVPSVWPKVYDAGKGVSNLGKDDHGNVFATLGLVFDFTHNFNHVGLLPPPPYYQEYTVQYNYLGTTDWFKTREYPIIALQSGDIQMFNQNSSFLFYNGATGNAVNPPPLAVSGESIIAQTNNGSIISVNSHDGNVIYAHSSSQATTSINLFSLREHKFNPLTNRLIIEDLNILKVFTYTPINNTLNLIASVTLPPDPVNGGWVHINQVDNQDRVYVVKDQMLQEFDYIANTFTPVTISGFNNTSIYPIPSYNPYTEDHTLVSQGAESNLYAIDFSTMTKRKIHTTKVDPYYHCYLFDGDNVFLGGSHIASPFTIGTQNIPSVSTTNGFYQFLTRLNLQTDFTLRSSEILQTTFIENKKSFNASLIPNPVNTAFKIEITENEKQKISAYTVSIIDRIGIAVLKKEKYISGNSLDISGLKTGTYYVEIINTKGEKLSKSIIKL
jgi:hypothetical protein